MSITVKVEGFDAGKAAKRLFDNDRIGLACAGAMERHMYPYVPRDAGILVSETSVKPFEVTYNQPYAHFQYVGKLMIGAETRSPWAKKDEKKEYASPEVDLVYAKDKNPKAGKKWDKAMIEDKGAAFCKELQAIIGRG